MRIALISQNDMPKTLEDAAVKLDLSVDKIDISSLSLMVESGRASVLSFDHYDAAIIMVPWKFMLFVEPMLEELSERGVYSQIKPTAFNLLANRPFTYYVMKSKGIPMPYMRIYSGKRVPELGIVDMTYPVKAELYKSFNRTQQVIFESEESLKSYLKGIDTNYDVLVLMSYERGDIEENLVIGDEVYTIKKAWVESKSAHSTYYNGVKMSDSHNAMIIGAAKNLGLDAGVIITCNGKVIDARISFDMDVYSNITGSDIAMKLLDFVGRRVKGS
ncbi:MAG: hypothetical protein ACMXYL_01030 [Candidatus Woesearchaeota archaeon]